MRLATFNVENLFERPKAMNLDSSQEGKTILQDHQRLNELIQEPGYTQAIKDELLEIFARHPGLLANDESRFMFLRRIRGSLGDTGPARITATGRNSWIGWFELKTEPVRAVATENTARIIDIVNADVIGVVEAEGRPALKRFNSDVIQKVGGQPYDHVMLIDGNDNRGIDVGVMTRPAFEIVRIVSHVDDRDEKGTIFSRDCAEYEIRTPSGNTLLVLVNHFKSKGFGSFSESTEKRQRQAARTRAIYEQRISEGHTMVAVIGDLNEVPDGPTMIQLTGPESPLTDVMAHPLFQGDGRQGTYANGTKSQKLDYILMSPALSAAVTAAGIERRGVWGGVNGTLFPHLPEMARKIDAASDHAALWVDVDL